MTVSTEINHEEYVGNGITYVFPYRFRIFKASNMAVVSVDVNGVEKNLVLNTDFTLSGVGAYTGGNVTLTNPLPSGWGLTLTRELKAIQETDLRNQGTFFAETHEDAFDYLTMLIQQVGSWFTLALRKPTFLSKFYDAKQNRIANLAEPINMKDAATKEYTDSVAQLNLNKTLRVPEGFINEITPQDLRKNKVLAFNNSGDPIAVLPGSGTATDVMIELAKPTGASLIGASIGNTVQQELNELQENADSNLLLIRQARHVKIGGRRANQIMQISAPTQMTLGSGVPQGLFVDETTGEFYVTWDASANSLGTIIRKLDPSGAVLDEFTFSNLGHADSFSKYITDTSSGFLIGDGNRDRISNFNGTNISAQYTAIMPGRVLGTALLIAVNQYDYSDCAFFYRLADGTMRITHSVPLADLLSNTAVGIEENTFSFSLPNDSVGPVNFQSFAYYGDTVIIWAGNDSRSGEKLLSTYNKKGQLLERFDVQADRIYSDIEGTITEPEGLSISRNSYTGGADIHLVKCFGNHTPSQTIIRVYKFGDSQSDNGIWMEGQPERRGAMYHPQRICQLQLMFEKVTGGWNINAGSVQSPIGWELASNIRYDIGGQLGIYFDLYKPYVSLIGWSFGVNAGFSGHRIEVGASLSTGGGTSNKNCRITFFDINGNMFLSANDAKIENGNKFCLTLTVGFYK